MILVLQVHNACDFEFREDQMDLEERNEVLLEAIQQLLDVGREGLLRIPTHSNMTASDIYTGRTDRSQDIVDRFIEIV